MSANLRIGLLFFLALLVGAMWLATFASKRQERVIAGVVPLEAQHFDALTLITLGSGGSFENHQRRGPALLIGAGESALLVDAGRGVSEALRAASVPVQQPRHVLLSSLLPENVLGLDDLWLDAWLARPRAALHVYGPPGAPRVWWRSCSAHTTPARARCKTCGRLARRAASSSRHEVAGDARFTIGALQVTSATLSGGALPALAWRVKLRSDAGASSLSLTGNKTSHAIVTAFGGTDADAIANIARGASLFVVEAVYDASLALAEEAGLPNLPVLRAEAALHPRLEDIGALATRADVQAIVLTRLRPPPVFAFQYERLVAQNFRRGPVFVAADGDRFTP